MNPSDPSFFAFFIRCFAALHFKLCHCSWDNEVRRLEFPHIAETFVFFSSKLWVIIWDHYIRDVVPSKLHFQFVDYVAGHGGVERINLPKPWVVIYQDQVVVITSNGLWSDWMVIGRLYRNWWNFSRPKTTANNSFPIWAYLVSASDSTLLANATGCPFWVRTALNPVSDAFLWSVNSIVGSILQDWCFSDELLQFVKGLFVQVCPVPLNIFHCESM